MEAGRKSILVAALSTYADLLAKSTSELDLGQGKGKGKASDDDVDLEAERLDQLNLCGELIAEATSNKDKASACGEDDSNQPRGAIPKGFSPDWHASKALFTSGPKRKTAVLQCHDPPEEYADPLTGFPVIQETGFEPGPSSRPPQPMRNYSWKPAALEPKGPQNGSKAPATLTRAASLPISGKPSPQPRPSEQSPGAMSSWLPQVSPSLSQSNQVRKPFQSSGDLKRSLQGMDERNIVEAEKAPNPANKGGYMSRLSNLTSKAFKSAADMLGMNQTNQTQPIYQDPPPRETSLVKPRNESRENIQNLKTTPIVAAAEAWKRAESPPPAYHTLSHGTSALPQPHVVDSPRSKQETRRSRSGTTTHPVLTDDEAFARMLQEEEYREIQQERDMLLALSLANGTADRGDVELAHFMAREYEDLIASTGAPAGATTHGVQASDSKELPRFDFSQWDAQIQQEQLDHLYALQIEETLRAEELANDAGWAEAMRLQEEYDRETENHEAWEEYKKTNFEECVVCGDENHKEEFLRPCEHGYCEDCLQAGFKNALASKTPFKCCKKNLSVDDCTGLEADFVVKYQELILELTTSNPMYCCNVACAKFLPPASIVGEVGTCGSCKTQTCRHCRKRTHPGVFCEEDRETKAVKELAMQKGWKTCPGCNHLIERQSGCLHMICSRCQTAFCYRCSKRWNDCESTCPDPISATHPKYPGRN